MSYSVNPSKFSSIFAVPAEIVDKHIRLANGHQLKVLLWILRNNTSLPDIDKMCKDLKINKDDAEDSLQYWGLTGVLLNDGKNEAAVTAEPAKPVSGELQVNKAETAQEIPSAPPSKPSSKEILDRISESPEIGHLLNEAQIKLGKTIGYDGQCTLLLLHDHYGLPTEVLFMLIEYCVSVGKTNYAYIETVGKDWGTREIDTLEKAAEQISRLKNANSIWSEVATTAGLNNPRPTTKQAALITKWNKEFGYDAGIIYLAYEEMVNHTGKLNFNYMDKILTNWFNSGVKNSDDIEALKEIRANAATKPDQPKKPQKSAALEHKASYDLDKLMDDSLHSDLVYERKKKDELQ